MTIQSDEAVKALGEVVKRLRLERGDSQTIAASRVGVSLRTWQRMESAAPGVAGQVAMGDFVAALEIYGVDVIELLRPLIGVGRPARQRGRTPTLPTVTTGPH
ncbi:MAG: helix-turn-helix transcriptional regulator [Variovorax sp.]|jgi:transcriptional regulator with XRE-family HTH domain